MCVYIFLILEYQEKVRLEGTACLYQILLYTGKTCYRNVWNVQVAFVEQKWWRTQVSEWFSKFKNSMTPDETFQNSQCLPTHQTEENVDPLKTLVLENRRVTIHGVSNICRFHFGQFREIWMTLSTCIRLPSNSWLTCFICAWISGSKQNNCHSTPYLVTTCSTMWILFFPRIPDGITSKEI